MLFGVRFKWENLVVLCRVVLALTLLLKGSGGYLFDVLLVCFSWL